MSAIVLILTALLTIGYLGVRAATWLRIPHSVFLVLIGIVSGLLLRHGAPAWTHTLIAAFPQVILYILLPPLVFEAALHLDFDHLKRDLVPVSALSIAGLVVSTFFIGWGLHWLFQLPLLPCLTFGSLISATDPVAVVSLFREVGAPVRLSTLIEGESLLNDGTAMVLFRILLAASLLQAGSAQPLLFTSGAFAFVTVFFGSLLAGFVMAGLTSILLRMVSLSGAAQLGITLASAYLSFVLSDTYLHLSGVMTTLVVGIHFGRRARIELNRDAYKSVNQIWQFLALSANTIVFLAVGMTMEPALLVRDFAFIPTALLITFLARAVSVFSTLPLINRLGLSAPISLAYQAVLVWGGLRGGLALGLVLTLPTGFPYRDLFIALAVAIVLSTLIINALTTRRVLCLLNLDRILLPDRKLEESAAAVIYGEALEALKRIGKDGVLSPSLIAEHDRKARAVLLPDPSSTLSLDEESELRFTVSSLLASEKEIYEVRLDEGVLSKAAYLRLTESVSERMRVLEASGLTGLADYRFGEGIELTWRERFVFVRLRHRSADRLLLSLVVHLEMLIYLRSALESFQPGWAHSRLSLIHDKWRQAVARGLEGFYSLYAHYSATLQSQAISDGSFVISQRRLDRLLASSVINPPVYASLEKKLKAIHRSTLARSRQLLRPSGAYLLGRIPLFQCLPRILIRKIAEAAPVRVISPGRSVVQAGEREPSLYVVVAGVLKLAESPGDSEKRLFSGDHFGIRPLLLNEPHPSTVLAEGTSEMMVIHRSLLDILLRDYPSFFSPAKSPELLSDSVTRFGQVT